MLSFKQFIKESAMRQGLPHFKDLKPNELHSLISTGKLSGNLTEKTDGLAFKVGHDKDGFYTQSARSDKVRTPTGYSDWGITNGKESPFANHYDNIHQTLSNNPNLRKHLEDLHNKSGGQDVSIQGEMFWKPLGEPSEKGIKFVGTHYDPNKMGSHGTFVMHSKLPNNVHHDPNKISELSNDQINFAHDKVANGKVNLDVSDELNGFNNLDHEKMNSRKKADFEEKEYHKRKFDAIKKNLENRLRIHINNKVKPKFGNETEGYVFHPNTKGSPRFKLTSDNFAAFKADQMKAKEEK